jgi:TolB-like protein
MFFINNLKRRKIVQWTLTYLAAAWLVLQLVDVLGERWGVTDTVGRVVDIGLFVGLFITVVIAWYHGEKGRQWVSGPELLILAALLTIGAIGLRVVGTDQGAAGGTDQVGVTSPDAARAADEFSIAVLPFRDFSEAQDQDWFAAGMHEALLTSLQEIHSLRVTSRTSSMRYRDSNLSLRDVAAALGVAWLVEGAVIREGDRIRISAKLIDGRVDHQVWAEQYERDADAILALQNDVARSIAGEVRATLTPEEQQRLALDRRVDPAAYRAYIRGLDHYDRVTPADFERSIDYFERAISLAPDFPQPYAALAVAYGIAVEYGWRSRSETRTAAEDAARTALRLDPELGDAHHALASLKFHYDRDFHKAEREYARALELTKDAYVYFGYGWLLSQLGRHEEAVAALQSAVTLDPLSPVMHTDLGWWLYGSQLYRKAIEQARIALEADVNHPEAYWLLAAALAEQKKFDESLKAFDRYETLYGEPVHWFRGYLLALAGQRDDALATAQELQGLISQGKAQPIDLAQIYLALGDHEATLGVLERATEAGVSFQPFLWPQYRDLWADSRFQAVLDRFNLPRR